MKSAHAYHPGPVLFATSRLAVNLIVLAATVALGLSLGGLSRSSDRAGGLSSSTTRSTVEPVDSSLVSSGAQRLPAALASPPSSTELSGKLLSRAPDDLNRPNGDLRVVPDAFVASDGSALTGSQSGAPEEWSHDDDASLHAAWDRFGQSVAAGIKRARESVVALEYTPSDAVPGTRRLATGVVINHRGDLLSIRIDRPPAATAADHPAAIVARDAIGRRHAVRWIASDAQTGLTLLRISSRALRPIRPTKEEPELGSQVFVVGNPFGMEHSVSRGHIAGLERTLELGSRQLGGLIQIQTPLYPGDSGAVVVNLRGEWLGMIRSGLAVPASSGTLSTDATRAHPSALAVSARISQISIANELPDSRPDFDSDPDNGFGFAISSRDALWVAEQLRRDGRVNRAYLGVRIDLGGNEPLVPVPTSSDPSEFATPSVNGSKSESAGSWSASDPKTTAPSARDGASVREVLPDTPASACGLRAGDLIVSLDGLPIHSAHDLTDRLDHISTHTTIKLIVMRTQGTKTDRVQLALETASRPETPIRLPASLAAAPAIGLIPKPSATGTAVSAPRDTSILPGTLRQNLSPEIVQRLQELESRLEKLERSPASTPAASRNAGASVRPAPAAIVAPSRPAVATDPTPLRP